MILNKICLSIVHLEKVRPKDSRIYCEKINNKIGFNRLIVNI